MAVPSMAAPPVIFHTPRVKGVQDGIQGAVLDGPELPPVDRRLFVGLGLNPQILKEKIEGAFRAYYGEERGKEEFAGRTWSVETLISFYQEIQGNLLSKPDDLKYKNTFGKLLQVVGEALSRIAVNSIKIDPAMSTFLRIENVLNDNPIKATPDLQFPTAMFFHALPQGSAVQEGLRAAFRDGGEDPAEAFKRPWTAIRFVTIYEIISKDPDLSEKFKPLIEKMRGALQIALAERIVHAAGTTPAAQERPVGLSPSSLTLPAQTQPPGLLPSLSIPPGSDARFPSDGLPDRP